MSDRMTEERWKRFDETMARLKITQGSETYLALVEMLEFELAEQEGRFITMLIEREKQG